MSPLVGLKSATSLSELALLLGVKPSSLSYTLYKIPNESKYETFHIPKKAGGTREIYAPIPRLKSLQRTLANILHDCVDELEVANPHLKPLSHGFRRRRSIVTNARLHRHRRYVLNLDLENFFPTFNFGRVRGFFLKNRNFELHENVATVIAQIACHNNILPQGSPSSPIVSDLVGHLLDVRLSGLAKKYKCTYSRYADDLTFSTNCKIFPEALAYELASGEGAWVLGDKLLNGISRCGFAINHKKTRMQLRTNLQLVTGLAVNQKVNIPASYYRASRLMCAALFASGEFYQPSFKREENPPKGTLSQLEGVINYIYYVKYQEKLRVEDVRQVSKWKNDDRRGIEKLYDRLLFFKNFVALKKPLILCEGKTDGIYLRTAIRQLPAFHGKLIEGEAGNFRHKLSYFRFSRLSRSILRLSGGTGDFSVFINRYRKMLVGYKYAPLAHPVIILIDNDSGAAGIFKILNTLHVTISHTTTLPFYHVFENLYVIKTPEIGAKGTSAIEDLFDEELQKTDLDGKKFNRNKDHESIGEYGKEIFAKRVVVPNAGKIEFAKFVELLNRIVAVIEHYETLP